MTQTPPKPPPLSRLPLLELGFVNCPAIPYWVDLAGDPDTDHVNATLASLLARGAEGMPAYVGLSTKYTIDGQTHSAYEFLYGSQLAPGATALALDKADEFTLPWTTYGDVYEDSQDLVKPLAKTLRGRHRRDQGFLADDRKLRPAVLPPRPREGRRCASRPLRHGVRQRLDDREARPRPASRAPVRDRHEHPCGARAVHRTRRHRALHPGHHHAAQTGSSDQGAHAGSDPAVDDERRPTTRLRQERPGVALCAPGGEDLDHGVGHLAGTRLSPAHRHGCDADDHVQPSSRRPRAPAVAGTSVAASHRFRFRPAHDPLSEDLPAHAGQRPPCARQAPRPVRCESHVPRRRPARRARGAWTRERGLHEEQGLGPVPAGGVADRRLEDHSRLREGGRRRHLQVRRRREERQGLEGLDGCERRPVARQPQGAAGRRNARRPHESAHESPVSRQRARGWNPGPGGQPGARLRRDLPAVPPERRHHRARHSGRPHEGPAASPAAHRHHRRDDDLLLHVRLLPAVRAADPDRGHQGGAPLPAVAERSATRRCSSTGRTSTTSSTPSSRTGTRRLRGSAGHPGDRRRRMPTISTSSGPSASSSDPHVGLLQTAEDR